MENKESLQEHLQIIEAWEKDQKGLWFWEKLGRLPFKFLDKMTPKFIQNKMGVLVNELGSYIQTGGQYLINEQTVLKNIKTKTPESTIETIADVGDIPLQTMVEMGEDLLQNRVKLATVQGASTGIGGIFTLAIDIPILLGLALKTLQEIAIIHGYDPQDKQERVFIVKCLQFASADIVGKEAILKELSTMHEGSRDSENMISQLQGWKEVVLTYRDQFGWKKLFQMVPIAGIIFGAFANRGMINDIAETGNMLYRKRRIMGKMNEIESLKDNPL
ncbi:EcsC family protein [Bacillus sp. AGMB 02131]|uniref:EcsC family protein n=1 Tax=Peribacillus faecalis TaxID=2772559 RepID=A0A927CYP1_9BACI|nr:EcsC family protein [Peribacillus faecalis]MBD3107759.1 EcsC family protein [Peribacillus faecalis]